MTQFSRGLGLLAGIILMTAWNSSSAWSADAKPGKATYGKLCASCHGADGKGNPAMIKALGKKGLNIVGKDTKAKKDQELLKVIAQGTGKMPASGKGLSQQEQKDVLAYTRSLAK
jgi:alcohol dehydrogenase (quinone), cytochrome c subunit